VPPPRGFRVKKLQLAPLLNAKLLFEDLISLHLPMVRQQLELLALRSITWARGAATGCDRDLTLDAAKQSWNFEGRIGLWRRLGRA
jgi:hypothetical protein